MAIVGSPLLHMDCFSLFFFLFSFFIFSRLHLLLPPALSRRVTNARGKIFYLSHLLTSYVSVFLFFCKRLPLNIFDGLCIHALFLLLFSPLRFSSRVHLTYTTAMSAYQCTWKNGKKKFFLAIVHICVFFLLFDSLEMCFHQLTAFLIFFSFLSLLRFRCHSRSTKCCHFHLLIPTQYVYTAHTCMCAQETIFCLLLLSLLSFFFHFIFDFVSKQSSCASSS